jgi:hypothetical protein
MESSAKKNRSNRFIRISVSLVSMVLVALILGLIILVQGRVSGVEFSPTNFQRRNFHFFEIPVLEQQITPITRTNVSHPTLSFLRNRGFVTVFTKLPPRWDLVSLSRGLSGSSDADAELLMTPLETEYWKSWSEQNLAEAKILWPITQKLALRELYLLVPPLLEIAQSETNTLDFEDQILAQLRSDVVQLTEDLRAENNMSLADQIFRDAKSDFPSVKWP